MEPFFFQDFGFQGGWPNIHPYQGRGWQLLSSSRLAELARATEYVNNALRGNGLRNVIIRMPRDQAVVSAVVRYKAMGAKATSRTLCQFWADCQADVWDVTYRVGYDVIDELAAVKRFEDWFVACLLECVFPVYVTFSKRREAKYRFDIMLLPIGQPLSELEKYAAFARVAKDLRGE